MRTLEETLEELTPVPDPDFVAEMERRMELGFPPKKPPRFARPALHLPKLRRPALAGAAASALLALMVSLAIVNDDGGGSGTSPQPDGPVAFQTADDDAAGPQAGREAIDAEELSVAPPTTVPPQPIPPGGDVAPGARERRVEHSAQLSLAAGTGEFDQVADSVFRIADRRDGFVLRSSFTEGEGGPSGGFFDLRVPAAQLQPTLNELSRVATVRSRSESATDVTGSFVAVRDRLGIARAERRSLLGRLERAETGQAASAIRRRLEIVAREIAGLRSQLRGMRERTGYAAVSIELLDEAAGPGAAKSDTEEAVDDAVGSLEDILVFLIRALGILAPVTLAGLAGWFAASRARRRARERALA